MRRFQEYVIIQSSLLLLLIELLVHIAEKGSQLLTNLSPG